MENQNPSTSPKRSWRERLGLQQQRQPDPDAWVAIASGQVDDKATGFSEQAGRVAESLNAAGIDVQLHPYVAPDQRGTGVGLIGPALLVSSPGVTERIRVAVLVHQRDLERVDGVAGHIQHERLEWHSQPAGDAISDEELTRLSLGASENLKRDTGSDS